MRFEIIITSEELLNLGLDPLRNNWSGVKELITEKAKEKNIEGDFKEGNFWRDEFKNQWVFELVSGV